MNNANNESNDGERSVNARKRGNESGNEKEKGNERGRDSRPGKRLSVLLSPHLNLSPRCTLLPELLGRLLDHLL